MATIAHPAPSPTVDMPHVIGIFPQVARIYAATHGNLVSVWTVVDDFSRAKRNQVYQAERRLFEAYPETNFDFHVVPNSADMDITSAELIYVR